jgi:hypothetical protein
MAAGVDQSREMARYLREPSVQSDVVHVLKIRIEPAQRSADLPESRSHKVGSGICPLTGQKYVNWLIDVSDGRRLAPVYREG